DHKESLTGLKVLRRDVDVGRSLVLSLDRAHRQRGLSLERTAAVGAEPRVVRVPMSAMGAEHAHPLPFPKLGLTVWDPGASESQPVIEISGAREGGQRSCSGPGSGTGPCSGGRSVSCEVIRSCLAGPPGGAFSPWKALR